MLFIFRVDTGTMINLDMNLALETVAHLQASVASYCNIPVEKQVLLISGGESLEPCERVCKYTAGSSDTNPIFLFSVSTLEGAVPPSCTETVTDRDLQPEVESSLSLPDTHNTVAVRASLAQEYVKVSREQVRLCEGQIHDQHLQHQGWAAALANLEDSVLALEKRKRLFEETYHKYLEKRDHYRQVIETFDDDLHVLSKIPILPALLEEPGTGAADSGHGSNGISPAETAVAANGGPSSSSSSVVMGRSRRGATTLLDWINEAGNSSLEQVADSCYRSLEQLDDAFLCGITSRVTSCVEGANNQQMKEIRGLGDRLSGLEQLLLDAKKKVAEQQDLAAAFLQNQARASGLKDTSILPDLCASHRQQLLVMMRNHQHILSIRKRCAKAKEELSQNLYTRLKWVMFIQRQMAETGQHMVLYFEELKRLSRRLEVMEQLHLAPSMYLATVVEVVRRRSFSEQFLAKSGGLAAKFSAIHKEEMTTRTVFQEKLSKHFLSTMFRGMTDFPPPFATEKPTVFDDKLPKILLQDLEKLRSEFPDIAESLSVPDKTTLSSLLTKSFSQNLTPEEDDALHNLHNLTNKLNITGDGLGSVSVMNKICGADNASRKKYRLEALAASRERELASETDTDDEGGSKGSKGKIPRKMSRSFPSKHELRTSTAHSATSSRIEFCDTTGSAAALSSRTNVSSSSADPSTSSGANTNSSNAPSSDGSMLKQTWPSQSEIQAQVEEKSREIEKLTSLLGEAGSRREKVEETLAELLGVSTQGLQALRTEMTAIKSQVDKDRADVLAILSEMTGKLINSLNELEVLKEAEAELSRERGLREVGEQEAERLRQRLESELGKLEDCHKEIDIYRYQLVDATKTVDQLTMEKKELAEEQKERLNTLVTAQEAKVAEIVARHEQEMEELRGRLETERDLHGDAKVVAVEKELERQTDRLRECQAQCQDYQAAATRLELSLEDRLNTEKEKIVKILEAGFSERQRNALISLETELRQSHKEELKQTKEADHEDMCSRLEELRQKLIETSQVNLERAKEKLVKEWEGKVLQQEQVLRQEFLQEKEALRAGQAKEVEEAKEKMKTHYKREMENLRGRFRIMQGCRSSANLDRSPSVSESELSLESPRNESVDLPGKILERVGEERLAWEREREELRRELAEARSSLAGDKETQERRIQDLLNQERLRSSAEKQVNFNEAIRKTIEEKDKQIKRLEEVITSFQEENQLAGQLDQLSRSNAQLKSELSEAKERLTNSMLSSIAVTSPAADTDSLRQLQEENQLLKQQLSRSMTSLISSARVSVNSAEKGEVVLVVWSDTHSNYSIYYEGSVLHFLHTESMESLGLALEKGTVRKKYTTAEVVDKEYCQARKPENRFNVPQGTKFYRVKCKPVQKSTN